MIEAVRGRPSIAALPFIYQQQINRDTPTISTSQSVIQLISTFFIDSDSQVDRQLEELVIG